VSSICTKYRIYPTKSQISDLEQTITTCRELYNSLLNSRKFIYETENQSLSCYEQIGHIVEYKKNFPELSEVHSQVLQNVAVRVDLAFQAFFRRVKSGETPGFPRFKKDSYDSFTYPQTGFSVSDDSIRISKVGVIKAKIHRDLQGKIKTCTIRKSADKWYACFSCETQFEPLPESDAKIGIDVGLEKFASLSDGTYIENPRYFRRDENALAKAQRKLARQKRGTRHSKKARKVVSKIHSRIKNRRHDFVHQASRKIVNAFGVIAVEKLNIKNMSASPKPKMDEDGTYLPNGASQKAGLNKSICDAAWSLFRFALSYKAENAGREIIEVNPAYTSQDCSGCGYRAKKTLKERWHFCPICSLSLDRDHNAAVNILNILNILQFAVGTHSVR
jgi:putative transposase